MCADTKLATRACDVYGSEAHAGLASELAHAEIGPCVRDDFSYLGFRVLVPPPLADSDPD